MVEAALSRSQPGGSVTAPDNTRTLSLDDLKKLHITDGSADLTFQFPIDWYDETRVICSGSIHLDVKNDQVLLNEQTAIELFVRLEQGSRRSSPSSPIIATIEDGRVHILTMPEPSPIPRNTGNNPLDTGTLAGEQVGYGLDTVLGLIKERINGLIVGMLFYNGETWLPTAAKLDFPGIVYPNRIAPNPQAIGSWAYLFKNVKGPLNPYLPEPYNDPLPPLLMLDKLAHPWIRAGIFVHNLNYLDDIVLPGEIAKGTLIDLLDYRQKLSQKKPPALLSAAAYFGLHLENAELSTDDGDRAIVSVDASFVGKPGEAIVPSFKLHNTGTATINTFEYQGKFLVTGMHTDVTDLFAPSMHGTVTSATDATLYPSALPSVGPYIQLDTQIPIDLSTGIGIKRDPDLKLFTADFDNPQEPMRLQGNIRFKVGKGEIQRAEISSLHYESPVRAGNQPTRPLKGDPFRGSITFNAKLLQTGPNDIVLQLPDADVRLNFDQHAGDLLPVISGVLSSPQLKILVLGQELLVGPGDIRITGMTRDRQGHYHYTFTCDIDPERGDPISLKGEIEVDAKTVEADAIDGRADLDDPIDKKLKITPLCLSLEPTSISNFTSSLEPYDFTVHKLDLPAIDYDFKRKTFDVTAPIHAHTTLTDVEHGLIIEDFDIHFSLDPNPFVLKREVVAKISRGTIGKVRYKDAVLGPKPGASHPLLTLGPGSTLTLNLHKKKIVAAHIEGVTTESDTETPTLTFRAPPLGLTLDFHDDDIDFTVTSATAPTPPVAGNRLFVSLGKDAVIAGRLHLNERDMLRLDTLSAPITLTSHTLNGNFRVKGQGETSLHLLKAFFAGEVEQGLLWKGKLDVFAIADSPPVIAYSPEPAPHRPRRTHTLNASGKEKVVSVGNISWSRSEGLLMHNLVVHAGLALSGEDPGSPYDGCPHEGWWPGQVPRDSLAPKPDGTLPRTLEISYDSSQKTQARGKTLLSTAVLASFARHRSSPQLRTILGTQATASSPLLERLFEVIALPKTHASSSQPLFSAILELALEPLPDGSPSLVETGYEWAVGPSLSKPGDNLAFNMDAYMKTSPGGESDGRPMPTEIDPNTGKPKPGQPLSFDRVIASRSEISAEFVRTTTGVDLRLTLPHPELAANPVSNSPWTWAYLENNPHINICGLKPGVDEEPDDPRFCRDALKLELISLRQIRPGVYSLLPTVTPGIVDRFVLDPLHLREPIRGLLLYQGLGPKAYLAAGMKPWEVNIATPLEDGIFQMLAHADMQDAFTRAYRYGEGPLGERTPRETKRHAALRQLIVKEAADATKGLRRLLNGISSLPDGLDHIDLSALESVTDYSPASEAMIRQELEHIAELALVAYDFTRVYESDSVRSKLLEYYLDAVNLLYFMPGPTGNDYRFLNPAGIYQVLSKTLESPTELQTACARYADIQTTRHVRNVKADGVYAPPTWATAQKQFYFELPGLASFALHIVPEWYGNEVGLSLFNLQYTNPALGLSLLTRPAPSVP